MRVIYFSTDYGPHDRRFLAALADTPHEVFFLRLARTKRQTEDRPIPTAVRQLRWAGGQHQFHWGDLPRFVAELRRIVREIKPDLIHAGPIQTCAFIAALSGFRPVLTMSWGFDLMQDVDRSPWWRWATRYTLRRSSFFVSDARVTRAKAIALGMRPERTAIFPWGVDLEHFCPAEAVSAAKRPSKSAKRGPRRGSPKGRAFEDRFVIFCNRSWEERYGVDVLAKAFVVAAREDAAISLILLGSGSQAGRIRRILMEGGQIERVQFGGQVPQAALPRWYRMADLFVSPSHVDGSSVSLMEALACGKPALVSDIPANQEWVREGVSGWLFPDGDVKGLAEKMLWISAHRSSLARIGRAARRVAVSRADWKKNFRVLLRSYERALSGPQS